ncbi:MAG: trypsin-like peptidase domain-containing protein [Verrucomicrobia bacterium]|nr:trypsin-like peptidase domain-containing protein [Verrucomicrobiota bacterium]
MDYEQSPASASRSGSNFLTLLLLIISGFLLGLVAKEWIQRGAVSDVAPRPVSPRGDIGPNEQATIDLVNQVSPSVVFVSTKAVRRERTGFFEMKVYEVPQGTGSGFVWDKAGHIVTNLHVIADSDGTDVTLMDGSTWEAELVGSEVDKDIAVLQIDAPAEKLTPITVGESANLQVGQHVMAVGNPFGLDYTCTTGIIGGLGREIEAANKHPIQGVIQTDAAINPGNSGGPLVDSAGRLIGVNTAIFSPTGTSAGIGFAVPVDTVNRIVPQIINHGKVVKPDIGMSVQRLSQFGLVVTRVVRGSGAANAGIKPIAYDRWGRTYIQDILIAVEGISVTTERDVFRIIDNKQIGDKITVTILRNGAKLDVEIVLTPAP